MFMGKTRYSNMASKKNVARRGSGKRRDAEIVLELSRRAKAEVTRLLKDNRGGTVGRRELDTGLKEVEQRLKRMMVHVQRIL